MEEEKVEAIKASDLLKLMSAVEKGTGLYNFCERTFGERWNCPEFHEFGAALRELGLQEVQ